MNIVKQQWINFLFIPETRNRSRSYIHERHIKWQENSGFDQYLLLIAAIFALIGFATLSVAGFTTGFYTVHEFGLQLFPEYFWENITFAGDALVAVTIALLFSYRFPQISLAIVLCALFGGLVIHILKAAISLPRPPAVLEIGTFVVIGPEFQKGSMPSGHTATAFMLAGVLSRCLDSTFKKIGVIFFAALIGWSRVVSGVHWPADVCMGAALGLSVAWFSLILTDRWKMNFSSYLSITTIPLICAFSLLNFDGGFSTTVSTAQILGYFTLGYWLLVWLIEITGSKEKVSQQSIWPAMAVK